MILLTTAFSTKLIFIQSAMFSLLYLPCTRFIHFFPNLKVVSANGKIVFVSCQSILLLLIVNTTVTALFRQKRCIGKLTHDVNYFCEVYKTN